MAHRRLVRISGALLLAAGLLPAVRALAADPPQGLTLVSAALDGEKSDGASFSPSMSADGRYVAFASSAATLVPDDTNKVEDVFIYDRVARQTTRVSVSSAGVQGDKDSFSPSISPDGRFVAFVSSSAVLTSDDHDGELDNGELDILVHDRQSGSTTLASVASDGTQGDGPSLAPSISRDGAVVAFESDATNLVAGDANHTSDVFLRDLRTGSTRRLSVALDGSNSESPSFGAAVSADGRAVAFESFSHRLVPRDRNGTLDVFVADVENGSVRRVSVTSEGMEGEERSFSPSISADGRVIAFSSFAANLVPDDRNGQLDVFVHWLDGSRTARVNRGLNGAEADGLSFTPALSADGRWVAFPSEADNLVAGDTNDARDVFLAQTDSGVVTRLTDPGSGATAEGNAPSLGASLSASGVAFASLASNLVAGDTNGLSDVFVANTTEIGQK